MKLYHPVLFLMTLAFDLTMGTAQEFRLFGRPVIRETWTGPITGSVSYAYDNDLAVTSRRVNSRAAVTNSYDADKLLTRVGALTITRNPTNTLIMGTTLGSVSDTRSYNQFGELISYSATFGATPLYAVQYTRDALGRIAAKSETIGGLNTVYGYAYDAGGRLTNFSVNGASSATYVYDANNNRLTIGGESTSLTAAYDDQDRLASLGATIYTWTPNGELASKAATGQTTAYDYDVFGNLRRAALPGGTTIEYLVDGVNRRVGRKVNGAMVQVFLYEGALRPAAELDGAGNVVSEFVYGMGENVPEYLIKGGQTYRIICDHLGSPRLVVNVADGQIAQRIDYDPFGRVVADSAPGFQPFGFAGGLYDRDTGLVRFGARDYDADAGRWTAKDPILFAGGQANLYAYVDNDPVNFTDPSGLEEFSSGPSPQLPAVRKFNEVKKKFEQSGIQPGGQKDFCQEFNKKQAFEKGMDPPTGPGGFNFGLSVSFSF